VRHLSLQLPLHFYPGVALFATATQISLKLRSNVSYPLQLILEFIRILLRTSQKYSISFEDSAEMDLQCRHVGDGIKFETILLRVTVVSEVWRPITL
jgi:hypothetical protein